MIDKETLIKRFSICFCRTKLIENIHGIYQCSNEIDHIGFRARLIKGYGPHYFAVFSGQLEIESLDYRISLNFQNDKTQIQFSPYYLSESLTLDYLLDLNNDPEDIKEKIKLIRAFI